MVISLFLEQGTGRRPFRTLVEVIDVCARAQAYLDAAEQFGGDHLIEEGAANLKTFSAKIDTKKMKEPAFMMVLTGTGKYAYRRDDGVYVVPVGLNK